MATAEGAAGERRRVEATAARAGDGSLALALGRPATWVVALAGFLARGGFLVFVLPFVVLPTPVGVAIWIGPQIVSLATGGVPEELVALVLLGVGFLLAWLVGGGLVGAAAERWLILVGAAGESGERSTGAVGRPVWPVVLRVLTVRLVAHLPLALALSWALPVVVATTYRQLVVPDEVATPVVLRVLRAVPGPLGVAILAWLLGEVVGGLAARAAVLDDRPVPRALGRAVACLARHPVTTARTALLGLGQGIVLVGPGLVATSVAWDYAHDALYGRAPGPVAAAAALAFVTVWGASLMLAGVSAAWRAFAWTEIWLRFEPRGPDRDDPAGPGVGR